MWTHSLRHWPNIVPMLGERLVFAGLYHITAVEKCYVERAVPPLLGVGVKGSGPALNQCSHREHMLTGLYLLISPPPAPPPPPIPHTLSAFSQRWVNVLKRTQSLRKQVAFTQLAWLTVIWWQNNETRKSFNPFVTEVWWRRRTTWQNNGTLIHWFNPFVPEICWRMRTSEWLNIEAKNTLGRSVPVKTKTDVEEDGTSEDGSPRPVCN